MTAVTSPTRQGRPTPPIIDQDLFARGRGPLDEETEGLATMSGTLDDTMAARLAQEVTEHGYAVLEGAIAPALVAERVPDPELRAAADGTH